MIVGCFGLDETRVDVLGIGELILVQRVVLYSCSHTAMIVSIVCIKFDTQKKGTYSQNVPAVDSMFSPLPL